LRGANIHFEFYRHLQSAVDEDPHRDGITFGDVKPEYGENIHGFADIVIFDSTDDPAVVIEAKAPNGSGRSRQERDPYAPS
jgi:type I site-specific restriction endonuclease